MKQIIKTTKGFTLVELLIVIAILAALAAIIVLVINPGELLAQARDAQRISDVDVLRDAIALMLVQTTTPITGAGVNSCNSANTRGCCSVAACVTQFTGTGSLSGRSLTTPGLIDGTGWIDINFTTMAGGLSPIPVLPLDPTNTTAFFYAYIANPTLNTFEINTNLESARYLPREGTDGGNNTGIYEVGNDPGLDL